MAKKKLKKIAKNIAKQPKLKRKLAEYLASVHGRVSPNELETMLTKGHRGYLAISEKELTDLFDKKYEVLIKEKEEAVEKLADIGPSQWSSRHVAHTVKGCDIKISAADKIMDALFEDVFLVSAE